jgi:hypothetical protein
LVCYRSYGTDFLDAAFLYHFRERLDAKHNFSIWFYPIWLVENYFKSLPKSFSEGGVNAEGLKELAFSWIKTVSTAAQLAAVVYCGCTNSRWRGFDSNAKVENGSKKVECYEREERTHEQGHAQGHVQGHTQGRTQGHTQGHTQGRTQGQIRSKRRGKNRSRSKRAINTNASCTSASINNGDSGSCGTIPPLVRALALQALAFVAFNRVITAQYFLWHVQFIPLWFPSVITAIFDHADSSKREDGPAVVEGFGTTLTSYQLWTLCWKTPLVQRLGHAAGLWVLGEFHWLFWAYLLEFQKQESCRVMVWGASWVFLFANLNLMSRMLSFKL